MKGLLEELWRRAGCMYLSDLRSCSGERLRRALVSLLLEEAAGALEEGVIGKE